MAEFKSITVRAFDQDNTPIFSEVSVHSEWE